MFGPEPLRGRYGLGFKRCRHQIPSAYGTFASRTARDCVWSLGGIRDAWVVASGAPVEGCSATGSGARPSIGSVSSRRSAPTAMSIILPVAVGNHCLRSAVARGRPVRVAESRNSRLCKGFTSSVNDAELFGEPLVMRLPDGARDHGRGSANLILRSPSFEPDHTFSPQTRDDSRRFDVKPPYVHPRRLAVTLGDSG